MVEPHPDAVGYLRWSGTVEEHEGRVGQLLDVRVRRFEHAVSATAQDDGPAPVACAPTSADLQRAADAARVLEMQRPDVFEESPRPAGYGDLRLAAEWSSRMSVLDPVATTQACSR